MRRRRAVRMATALILRSRTERLRFLNTVHRELAGTAFLAVLAATLVSYAVARTVTRPLGAITATMREMAATGDLTRKIALSPSARWDDEDARLLAGTFNTMTDSIARFQREAAQRERLSSLGRLSTVVAHEIRNPLMIIKTALRIAEAGAGTVAAGAGGGRRHRRRGHAAQPDRDRGARLRPADQVRPGAGRPQRALRGRGARGRQPRRRPSTVHLDLDRTLDADRDRRRTPAARARQHPDQRPARRAGAQPTPAGRTPSAHPRRHHRRHRRARRRSRSAISGVGIAADDLARIFDPYFTTRRTGTGLGLAIRGTSSKDLAARLRCRAVPGSGTDVRIELPGTCAEL